jgi:membrane protease YdiL (CAAX protease family)
MLILILFQSVFFKDAEILYGESGQPIEDGGDFITVNDIKYKPDRFFILAVVSNICAFVLPAVFYVTLKGAGYRKNLKLTAPNPKYMFFCVYMFFMLISGAVLINSLIFYAGTASAGNEGVLPLIISTGGNPAHDAGMLLSFVLLPALCEEFFFRSVLAAEYEKHGVFCAVMVTSAAFAMSNFSLRFFLPYFFAAAALYIVTKITNSVFFAVALHAGYNFFNIYLWDNLSGVLNFEQNRFIFIFLTVIIFAVFAILALNALEIIYYKKAYNNEPSPVKLPENRKRPVFIIRFFKAVLSPTFIAAAVIFLIYVNL